MEKDLWRHRTPELELRDWNSARRTALLETIELRTNEAALVRAAQSGDRAAFGALYERYIRLVYGVLLAHVSYTEAQDLVQDVFLKAMEQIYTLRQPAAFGGWLASIARRLVMDDHRRNKRPIDSGGHLAGQTLPDTEAFEMLDVIQRLPESYRETLVLRLVEGMTGPEIAIRTGMKPDSVRVNLCRGMKLLRDQLKGRAKS